MATIKVNNLQWSSITSEEQQLLIETLIKAGSLKEGDEIIGDDEVPPHPNEPIPVSDFGLPFAGDGACEIACTATYDYACGLCAGLTIGGPVAATLCYAAASAAYGICLKECLSP